jgi:Escherichia/Staphylococcus phage prohead protease
MSEERYFNSATEVRAVTSSNGDLKIEGYAASYGVYSAPIGGPKGFKEKIRPGAFDRAIRERQDVRCTFNHDPKQILGRTSAGTLILKPDSRGLFYSCTLPNTTAARDAYESIRRGDVSQSSFAFNVKKPGGDVWGEDRDANGPFVSRELTDLDVYDVSPVTFPAYQEGTSVQARSKTAIFLEHLATTDVRRFAPFCWNEKEGRIKTLAEVLEEAKRLNERGADIPIARTPAEIRRSKDLLNTLLN